MFFVTFTSFLYFVCPQFKIVDTYVFQIRMVLQSVTRQKVTKSQTKQKAQSRSDRLVHLVTGSNNSAMVLEELADTAWEPFYGALYLSLDGISSDNMEGKVNRFKFLHSIV